MKLKYINSDYVPKGQLEGFPLEIIDKMLERQVEQRNEANVEVFENSKWSDYGEQGFNWHSTEEGFGFWKSVIDSKNFDTFFKKYPKEEKTFPRVIEVYEDFINEWVPRVCIKVVGNSAVCWSRAKTFEEAEFETETITRCEWKEVSEEPKEGYKPFDFSDGVANYKDLIGKTLLSKDGDELFSVIHIQYDSESGESFINTTDTVIIFENYTFENGEPVGIKIQKNKQNNKKNSKI